MNKHTPGPWHVVDGTFNTMIASDKGFYVTEVKQTGMGHAVEPNARLIASAPDLLDALRAARYCVVNAAVLRRIDAAISNATGEPL